MTHGTLEDAIDLFKIQLKPAIADPAIADQLREMCEHHGYGNVIATATVLYRQRDPIGAFTIGHCVGTIEHFLNAANKVKESGT